MGSEIVIVPAIVLGLPWIIFHYITRWKTATRLTAEDENLLDDLHELARRLDDRMCTVERIMAAENPNWRAVACETAKESIEDHRGRGYELGRDLDRSNQPARRM